jgi:transcription-repair coupling factor (superfamily II helicase)
VLASFSDLNTGDVIVHEDHGVARFTGFDTKAVAGVTRDYLELEYAGGDRVFLPVDQLAKISRYLGARDEDPQLSKLGGTAWERAKGKAKAAAELLAGELLSLYAERRRRSGHPFPPDGEMQRDFEHAFPHRETGDQLEAIESVKVDMESPQPMDRLICGDVGYGKTEVALRAAFKCATEGKQVLVLVPTTILAQQHFAPQTVNVLALGVQNVVVLKNALSGLEEVVLDALLKLQNPLGKELCIDLVHRRPHL